MAIKTISLKLEAYERLRAAKRAGESFSQVVMRARWEEEALTARELLERCRRRGPLLDEEALDRIDRLGAEDRPPEDKWREA